MSLYIPFFLTEVVPKKLSQCSKVQISPKLNRERGGGQPCDDHGLSNINVNRKIGSLVSPVSGKTKNTSQD